jgi:hypothetical protein
MGTSFHHTQRTGLHAKTNYPAFALLLIAKPGKMFAVSPSGRWKTDGSAGAPVRCGLSLSGAWCRLERLALGELEALAGALTAVLLAFFHPAIAG